MKQKEPAIVYTRRQKVAILITSICGVLGVAGVFLLALGVSGQLG